MSIERVLVFTIALGAAAFSPRRALTIRGVVVLILFLGVVLGSCTVSDGHLPDTKPGPAPCDIQPVNTKAGAEREPSLNRTVPAVAPGFPDTTVVWHCGPPPDTRPTVVAVNSLSLSTSQPRISSFRTSGDTLSMSTATRLEAEERAIMPELDQGEVIVALAMAPWGDGSSPGLRHFGQVYGSPDQEFGLFAARDVITHRVLKRSARWESRGRERSAPAV